MTAPENWKKRFLGRVAQLTMGQSPDSRYYSEEENGLPFLQGCAEFGARFPKHRIYCSQARKIARAGSILFSVRAPVGRINIADRDYIIGRGLASIIGTDIDQSYLEHYLIFREPDFRNASQGSTFEAISSAELNGWEISHPTFRPEQTKIAEILSTVDRAIEQTEALIAKQQRIKTGLMQDLLTRGIDEHGNLRSEETHQFKDSPLGRIPVEWEVLPFGDVIESAVDGPFGSNLKTEHYVVDPGVRVLRLQNVGNGEFMDSDAVWISSEHADRLSRHLVVPGDILVASLGDERHPFGRACLYLPMQQEAIVKADVFRIRCKTKKIDHSFVTSQ